MSNLNGFTASNEVILRECEAIEIQKIFNKQTINFAPHELISRVFDRIQGKCRDVTFGLAGVYLLGYIYGIRAERRYRKNRRLLHAEN